MRRKNKKFSVAKLLIFLFLVILAIGTIAPLLYMVMVTFLTKDQYALNNFAIPTSLNFSNYKILFQNFDFIQLSKNSLIISFSSVVLSLFVTTLAGYSLSKLQWKGKRLVYVLIATGMFMPGQVLILPVYNLFIKMGLINSYLGLIIFNVALSIPFTLFMIVANLQGINNEIIESAKIDGAGPFTVYRTVILPLLKPTLATVAILNFISYWNELLYSMIILQDESMRTVTVSIVQLANAYGSNPPVLYAGLLLSALPVIIIFFVLQKHIIKGVGSGAVKS